MNELLKNLTEAVGVSSNEKEVRLLIRDLIANYVDEWHVDALGNLLALKKGTGASPLRVLALAGRVIPPALSDPPAGLRNR